MNARRSKAIPMYPQVRWGLGAVRHDPEAATLSRSAFIAEGVVTTWNARSALAMGLRALGIVPGDEVLVPAYHCPVMIYPIVALGALPVYYRLREDCRIDPWDVETKLTPRTRAAIAVHYFGFPTPLHELRALCETAGVRLIEDCAHAFFGRDEDGLLGTQGDLAIASIYKFFPAVDGGCLRYNDDELSATHRPDKDGAPLRAELKSAFNSVELRLPADALGGLPRALFSLKDRALSRLRGHPAMGADTTPQVEHGAEDSRSSDSPYSPQQIAPTYLDWTAPAIARLAMRRGATESAIARRRANYQRLLAGVLGLDRVSPLFPTLGDHGVPYNFPLVCQQADELAMGLRQRNIGVARFGEFYWDDADRRVCPVSNRLSRSCIQLPIHQSLNAQDIDTMIEALGSLVGRQ